MGARCAASSELPQVQVRGSRSSAARLLPGTPRPLHLRRSQSRPRAPFLFGFFRGHLYSLDFTCYHLIKCKEPKCTSTFPSNLQPSGCVPVGHCAERPHEAGIFLHSLASSCVPSSRTMKYL